MSVIDERLEKIGKGLEETRNLRAILQLTIGTINRYFTDSEKAIDLKGTYCEPRIVDFSPLSESYNPENLEFQISDVSVDLANGDLYFSKYPFNHQMLIGATGKLYIGYEDVEFKDWKCIIDGKINKVVWQNLLFKINISDSLKKLDRLIPDYTLGTSEFPELDRDYIDRPLPYFYGDWTGGTTSFIEILGGTETLKGDWAGTYWSSGGGHILDHYEGTLRISPTGFNWDIGTVAPGTRFLCLKQFKSRVFLGDDKGNLYSFLDPRMRTLEKTHIGTYDYYADNWIKSMEEKPILGTNYLFIGIGKVLLKTPDGQNFEEAWRFENRISKIKTSKDKKYIYVAIDSPRSILVSESGTHNWENITGTTSYYFWDATIFGTSVYFSADGGNIFKITGTNIEIQNLEHWRSIKRITSSYKYLYAISEYGLNYKAYIWRYGGDKWEKIMVKEHPFYTLLFFKNKVFAGPYVLYREPTYPGGNFEAIPISNDRRKYILSRRYIDKADIWISKCQLRSYYSIEHGTLYNFGTKVLTYLKILSDITDNEIGTRVITFNPYCYRYGTTSPDVLKDILISDELGAFGTVGTSFEISKRDFPNSSLSVYITKQIRLGELISDIARQNYGVIYFEGGRPEFKILKDLEEESSLSEINKNDILEFQLERSIDVITNEVKVYYNYNEVQRIYRSLLTLLGTNAYLEYGIKQSMILHGKYLTNDFWVLNVARRWLNALQVGYYKLSLSLPLKYCVLGLGDIISITYDEGVSREGGFNNKKFRIYSIKKDFSSFKTDIEAFSPIEMYPLREDYPTILSWNEHVIIGGTT